MSITRNDPALRQRPPRHERDPEAQQTTLIVGDARVELRGFADETFQCCVTSPPYWGLRDYGIAGQIGAETKVERGI